MGSNQAGIGDGNSRRQTTIAATVPTTEASVMRTVSIVNSCRLTNRHSAAGGAARDGCASARQLRTALLGSRRPNRGFHEDPEVLVVPGPVRCPPLPNAGGTQEKHGCILVALIERLVNQAPGIELISQLSCREQLGNEPVETDLFGLGKLGVAD